MLKAYHVFTTYDHADNWGVLAFAKSPNKARSLAVGFYDHLVGFDHNEEYRVMRARRLPEMDSHWHQRSSIAMDGSENLEAKRLVDLSEIHECPVCGSNKCDWRCDE